MVVLESVVTEPVRIYKQFFHTNLFNLDKSITLNTNITMGNHPASDQHYLYFVRHGQSHGNATGEEIKPDQNFLTELGQKQVQALGAFFKSKEIKFHRAYSSHYPRAIETGKGILENIYGSNQVPVELCVDPRIREREGLTTSETWNNFRRHVNEGGKVYEYNFDPVDDTPELFVQRQKGFLKDVLEAVRKDSDSLKSSNTLIIGHGITLKGTMDGIIDGIFSDVILHRGDRVFEKVQGYPWSEKNTSVTKISVEFPENLGDPAVVSFHEINSANHLDQLCGTNYYAFAK